MGRLPCRGLGPILPVDAAVEQAPEGAVVESLWQSQQEVLGQLRGHSQFSQDLVIQNLPSGETLSLQVALPAWWPSGWMVLLQLLQCPGRGSHAPHRLQLPPTTHTAWRVAVWLLEPCGAARIHPPCVESRVLQGRPLL